MSRQQYLQYKRLLSATQNRKAGVPERGWKIISEDQMRAAEKVFWRKRGFDSPPGISQHLNFARKTPSVLK